MDQIVPAISVPSASPRVAGGGSTYSQILKSSSIIGGAQAVNYIIGMARVKLVAVLLGPTGIGLVGLYVSATDLVGTFAGLGINSSGVREVAEACGTGDSERIAHTVKTLRRACWITGVFGWLLTVALSYPLSLWTFGSGERAWAVAMLGVTLLLGAVSGGQAALIQGTRRIGDLARMNVLGAVAGTLIAVGLYAWLGQAGIVPVLIATAATSLGFSWWFARRIPVQPVSPTWPETFVNSKRLIHLGLAFMYGALLSAVVGLVIRALIVRKLGLDANGIYQAAWGISGMFAGFILGAMGTDFYPRLTAVADDNEQVNRLVNEQTEIGILLALPGLLGTLALAPWVMHIFYSPKFLPGAALLPWLVIGVFGQVLSWPLGFIQRAKGRARWIFASQTHANLWNLALAMILIPTYGVVAAAWAFALSNAIQGLVVFGIARHLSRFAWTPHAAGLGLTAAGMIGLAAITHMMPDGLTKIGLGALITAAACVVSLRGISTRLGPEHRILKLASRIPGGRLICGL
jgi:PST family polysaccharide transporter